MKKHNGMRPQDLVILLKIGASGVGQLLGKDLAISLFISPSEVSESLNRSTIAGLLDPSKKTVMKSALLEFLEHGIRYVFPQQPGAILRGMPTASSAPPLNLQISSNATYVWPDPIGEVTGQLIEPLHPGVVRAAKQDPDLYALLALVDALRIGRTREKQLAMEELAVRINGIYESDNGLGSYH